jgi:hypothetical protein
VADVVVRSDLTDALVARLPDMEKCLGPGGPGQRPSGGLLVRVTHSGTVNAVELLTDDVGALAPASDCVIETLSRVRWPDGFHWLVVPLGFDTEPPPPPELDGSGNPVTATAASMAPPPPQAHVEVGEVTAEGKLTAAQVKGPFITDKYKLMACYRDRLAENAGLAGELDLSLTIAQGRVATVQVVTSTLSDPTTEQCLSGMIQALTFPAERKETVAGVHLSLTSS